MAVKLLEKTAEKELSATSQFVEELGRRKTLTTEQLRRAVQIRLEILKIERELNELLQDHPRSFSPRSAGEQVIAQMQTAEGGAFTGAELEAKFGLTPATLHRRRKEHRIVFWRDARHAFHYPKWQFTDAGALRTGIQEVLQTFQSKDEWRVMRYFLGKRQQLGGRSPLELIRAGEVDKVLRHARGHAEENTW